MYNYPIVQGLSLLFYIHSDMRMRRYVWISQNAKPGWFEVWPMRAIKWPGSGRGALVD